MADTYRVTLAELERSAHVPLAETGTATAQPPPEGPLGEEDDDRQRRLSPTSNGRLRRSWEQVSG